MWTNGAFVVIAVGVYRHDVWGPFDGAKEARALAEQKAQDVPWRDGYHALQVCALRGGDDAEPVAEYSQTRTYHHEAAPPWRLSTRWEWIAPGSDRVRHVNADGAVVAREHRPKCGIPLA